jgi:hypothetical protein
MRKNTRKILDVREGICQRMTLLWPQKKTDSSPEEIPVTSSCPGLSLEKRRRRCLIISGVDLKTRHISLKKKCTASMLLLVVSTAFFY